MISDNPSIVVPIFNELKATFASSKTLSTKYRKEQLINLVTGLKALEQKFHTALNKDLNASETFSMIYNVGACISAVQYCIAELDGWAKPKSIDTPIALAPAKSYLQPEPYGVTLVMGAWNYPLISTIPYVAAAISAGNCVILKPSELSGNISNTLAELFENYLDKDTYRCVEGQVEVASELVRQPFDCIVFTGSPEKGKLVAKAAAENLIPCILELGGKSPTIVNKEADIENATLRIARARLLNSGQSCIACDYVFVHKDVKEKFVDTLKKKIVQFYGEDPSKAVDYGRIINKFHTQRLKSYLDENHGGKVLLGGQVNIEERYVAPTLIENPGKDSLLMQNELFGPILPIYDFDDIEEPIKFINSRPKPLALYYYGSQKSKSFHLLRTRTSSGSLVCNDAFTQAMNVFLPFGGIGQSGYGSLNGEHAFKSMSHFKPVMECNTNNGFPANVLFPPYTNMTRNLLKHSGGFILMKQSSMAKASLIFVVAVVLFILLKNLNVVNQVVQYFVDRSNSKGGSGIRTDL